MSFGINPSFPRLSQCQRQVTHVLLTRPPLIHFIFTPKGSVEISSLDLHVLSAPPAFVLSQDQTLNLKVCCSYEFWFLLRIFKNFSHFAWFILCFFCLHYLIFIFLRCFCDSLFSITSFLFPVKVFFLHFHVFS